MVEGLGLRDASEDSSPDARDASAAAAMGDAQLWDASPEATGENEALESGPGSSSHVTGLDEDADSAPPADNAFDSSDSEAVDGDSTIDGATDSTLDDGGDATDPDVAEDADASDATSADTTPAPDATIEALAAYSSACGSCAESTVCLDETRSGSNCERDETTMTYSPQDHANCLAVIECVLSEACMATGDAGLTAGDVAPCLCGTVNKSDCLHGVTPPLGPCRDAYFAAFGTEDVSMFGNHVYSGLFPGGSPGNLMRCLNTKHCASCFGGD